VKLMTIACFCIIEYINVWSCHKLIPANVSIGWGHMPESWIYLYVHIRMCDIDKFIPIIHFGVHQKLVLLLAFEADTLYS